MFLNGLNWSLTLSQSPIFLYLEHDKNSIIYCSIKLPRLCYLGYELSVLLRFCRFRMEVLEKALVYPYTYFVGFFQK